MKKLNLFNRSGESPDVTRRQCRNSLESIVSRLSVASLICLCMLTIGSGNAWATDVAVNDVLIIENFQGGDATTTFSAQSYSSTYSSITMAVSGDASSISRSSSNAHFSTTSASNMDASHAWLKKSTSGYIEIDDIPLHNVTKFQAHWAQSSAVQVTFYYKFNGDASWTSEGSCSSSNSDATSSVITVTSGKTSVSIKFQRSSSSSSASRIDKLKLVVTEVEASCTEITPSLTYSSTSLTVCGSNATVTGISGNTCSATPSYAVTAASPTGCITVNASTGEVTPVAAGSATVTATFPKTSTCCAATATKSFSVSAASERTVSWYVEGSVSTTTSVVPGNQATPPTPDPTSSCGGEFVGWVAASDGVVGNKPSDENITPPSTIYTSSNKPTITCDGNVEFHAVFRKN